MKFREGWHGQRPGVGRRLTLIGVCAFAPLLGPASCAVERAEARERQTIVDVVVRPVVSDWRREAVEVGGPLAGGRKESTGSVSVPRVALHEDDIGGPQVFVYSAVERRVHTQRVVLGSKRRGDVEIASGLRVGDMIVVGAREPLHDGMAARPINEPIVVTGGAPTSVRSSSVPND